MKILSGKVAFELKATHGVPLDLVFDQVLNHLQVAIDWAEFIEAARANGWWDFQTYDVIAYNLEEATVPAETITQILQRFKLYVLAHPHPNTISHE